MGNGAKVKDGDEDNPRNWVWNPNVSYGPFTFGTHRTNTPYVGSKKATDPLDGIDPSEPPIFYNSTIGFMDLAFWNDYLVGVEPKDTFVVNGVELIGAKFDDARHLVAEEPEIDSYSIVHFADFDVHNSMWTMDTHWRITSVEVGIDPDRVGP